MTQETRKNQQTKSHYQKNLFAEAIASNFKMANFSNYKFFRLRCFFEIINKKNVNDSTIKITRTNKVRKRNFCFRFVNEIE